MTTVKKPQPPKPGTRTPTVQPAQKSALGKIDVAKVPAGAVAVEKAPKKPFNPMKFLSEVRTEARRITWTSWKETWITTLMVLIMVVLAGLFFFLVDAGLGWAASYVTKLGQ